MDTGEVEGGASDVAVPTARGGGGRGGGGAEDGERHRRRGLEEIV